jgi:hypothetical protein
MRKKEFIEKIREAHREWEAVLAGLDEAQMLQPHTCGEWSVKDVVAHITWHEKEMASVLKERALKGSDLWNLTIDERNATICAENKDRPLGDVLAESGRVFQSLMEYLLPLTDEDLTDPGRFNEMPPDWNPWEVIASNTFEHYPDHIVDIRKAFGK